MFKHMQRNEKTNSEKNEFQKKDLLDGKWKNRREKISLFFRKCVEPENARLYGTFDQRTALNITQFPKIQGSLLIRMGMVYPLMSYVTKKLGLPADASSDLFGVAINYHTWIAGYLAYLVEIELGLSKYPIEWAAKMLVKAKNRLTGQN